jgi:hypothetical protein
VTRIAHDIVIDNVKREIRMDGVVFPFHVAATPIIESIMEGHMGLVTLEVYADNITILNADGPPEAIRTTTPAAEREWAQLAGRDAAIRLALKLGLLEP